MDGPGYQRGSGRAVDNGVQSLSRSVGTLGRVELPCGESRHQASRVVVRGPVDPDLVATLRHDRQGPHHAGGMNRAVRAANQPLWAMRCCGDLV